MRRSLWAILAAAILVGLSSRAPAQEAASGAQKPLVTVSLAGYDRLLADVQTIGKLAGKPDLAKGLEGALAFITQGKGLAGLDKTRPWGVVVYPGAGMDPSQFPVLGFLPVTDLKELMSVAPNPATGKPFAPNADGNYEIETGKGPTMYVAAKGKWAYLVNQVDLLKSAPADPVALLGDMSKRYSVAVRASIKNIPPPLRNAMMLPLQMGMQMGMQRQPGEGDEEYALRANVAKQSLEKISTLLKELDEFTVGLGADATQGATFLEIEVTALPGTKTAQQFAAMKGAKTNYGGFAVPGAAITASWAGTMDDAEVAQAKDTLETFRTKIGKELDANGDLSKDQQTLAKQLLTDAFDVLTKTLDGKKSDGGAAVVLETGAPAVVAGGLIAEGTKLEKVLKQLVAEAGKDEPAIAEIVKLDAGKHAGVNFHTAAIPVPDEDMVRILGSKTLDVVVGLSEDSIYLGAGSGAMKLLKQVIDDSKTSAGKAIPPAQVIASGTPIAKFISKVGDSPAKEVAGMVADILAKSPDKDHLTLTCKAIPNGSNIRLDIEDGLLKAILALSTPGGPGGSAPAVLEKETVPAKEDSPF